MRERERTGESEEVEAEHCGGAVRTFTRRGMLGARWSPLRDVPIRARFANESDLTLIFHQRTSGDALVMLTNVCFVDSALGRGTRTQL